MFFLKHGVVLLNIFIFIHHIILAWIFRTSWHKMIVEVGQNWKRVERYWPPMNSFILLGSANFLVKIDQEMRPWECSQTDTHYDRQPDRQTQTDFVICPMLHSMTMGQIKTMSRRNP